MPVRGHVFRRPAHGAAALLDEVRADEGHEEIVLRHRDLPVGEQHGDARAARLHEHLVPAAVDDGGDDDHIHPLPDELPHRLELGLLVVVRVDGGQVDAELPRRVPDRLVVRQPPAALGAHLRVAHADRAVDRPGRAVELALVAVHIFPRDRVAAQDDLLGHAAHLSQDVERKLDRLPAAGRTGDRLVDPAAANELQPAVRTGEAVDADDLDVVAAEPVGGLIGAERHIVVVREDHVELPEPLAVGAHQVLRRVARLVLHRDRLDLNEREEGGDRAEAAAARGARLRMGPALELEHLRRRTPREPDGGLPRLLADQVVVRPDEEGVVVSLHHPVEHDDGDLLVDLADHRRDPLDVVGRDDQQVDAVAEQALDVLDLLFAVRGRVGNDQPDFRVLGRLLLQLAGQHQPPRLAHVRLRDADDIPDLPLLRARLAACGQQKQGGAEQRRRQPPESPPHMTAPFLFVTARRRPSGTPSGRRRAPF